MFIWDWFTGVLGFLGESLFTNNIYLFQNFPIKRTLKVPLVISMVIQHTTILTLELVMLL